MIFAAADINVGYLTDSSVVSEYTHLYLNTYKASYAREGTISMNCLHAGRHELRMFI
jgi:hypothetical protein